MKKYLFEFAKRYRVLLYAAALILLVGLYVKGLIEDLPSLEVLREYRPTLSTKIYDCRGTLINELFIERRTWTPLPGIPVDMQNAALAIEDHRFFSHWGIVPERIFRAAVENTLKRRLVAGGSTITQQLAKLAFLSQEKTLTRKFKEFILALQIERNFSKQEILEMYLNQVYFGSGAYGVAQAARIFFSKDMRELTLAECASLAGLIRYPSYYSPFSYPARTIQRKAIVLERMRALNYIKAEDLRNAMQEPLNAQKAALPSSIAPYFVENIKIQLEPEIDPEYLYRVGWNIYTTLDLQMQATAEMVVTAAVEDFDKRRFEIKKSTSLPKVQVALLAMDPRNGQIKAMVGGRNFRESQFNRAVQARRQPGSAFKPIVYTAAIERGYTPATIIDDTPLVYVNDGRDWRLKATATDYLLTLPKEWLKDPMKVWSPQNYKKKYHGKVLLRAALEFSLNMCAVRTIEEVGPVTVISYARRLGIENPLTNTLSLALGASDVTLLEMVRAYGVFANRGIKTKPYSIMKIENNDGKLIRQEYAAEEDVLSEKTCYIITNILKGVINEGTGRYARGRLRRPAAGKTGTTNDFSDAWFIGYTPTLVCGVWVGYDDKTPLGEKNSGGVVACPIWTEFMRRALKGEPPVDFQMPPTGITFVNIDRDTGYLASRNSKRTYLEAFISGTEPAASLETPATGQMLNEVREEDEGGF
jgi:penicillin-binding protein 1A